MEIEYHKIARLITKQLSYDKEGKFRNMCKQFKPDIVLQHPHTTDAPISGAWVGRPWKKNYQV
jgi:hypothetical protein